MRLWRVKVHCLVAVGVTHDPHDEFDQPIEDEPEGLEGRRPEPLPEPVPQGAHGVDDRHVETVARDVDHVRYEPVHQVTEEPPGEGQDRAPDQGPGDRDPDPALGHVVPHGHAGVPRPLPPQEPPQEPVYRQEDATEKKPKIGDPIARLGSNPESTRCLAPDTIEGLVPQHPQNRGSEETNEDPIPGRQAREKLLHGEPQ